MSDSAIVAFPTLDSALLAIRLYGEENQLSPQELIDTIVAGHLQHALENPTAQREPIGVQWGRVSPTEPTKEGV